MEDVEQVFFKHAGEKGTPRGENSFVAPTAFFWEQGTTEKANTHWVKRNLYSQENWNTHFYKNAI